MLNYTKLLKQAPLPTGFFSIAGKQGAGKTSFAVGLLRTDYKRWRKWRYNQAFELAEQYRKINGIRLDINPCLYFSNTKILLDKRRGIYTHAVDLEFLGLPNLDYEVQYLPRGSVVFIQEADMLAYCRNWAKNDLIEHLRNLMKYVRHNLITIIFDMQVGGALDKALRELECGQFYMVDSGIKRYWLFWKCQRWKFLYTDPQLNAQVKELSRLGVHIKINTTEWGKFRVMGNVFNCYNSFSGLPYFLNGIEEVGYKYRKHVDGDMSVYGIKRYCTEHPLQRQKK